MLNQYKLNKTLLLLFIIILHRAMQQRDNKIIWINNLDK